MDILNTYIAPKAIEQPKAMPDEERAAIREAAEDFEAVFLAEMMRPIFDMQEKDPYFGGGNAEETYRSLLVDEYGKKISASGGIGLADSIERELIAMQEVK